MYLCAAWLPPGSGLAWCYRAQTSPLMGSHPASDGDGSFFVSVRPAPRGRQNAPSVVQAAAIRWRLDWRSQERYHAGYFLRGNVGSELIALPPNRVMTTSTRTEETEAQYRRRVEDLRKRVARIRGQNPADLLPMDLVDDLLGRGHGSEQAATDALAAFKRHRKQSSAGERKSGVRMQGSAAEAAAAGVISKATFRQYKAALRAVFQADLETAPTRYDTELLSAAIERLDSTPQTGYARKGRAGSALKSKSFKASELALVLREVHKGISESRHSWAVGLKTFLEANSLVGLRPCEWAEASIRSGDDGMTVMVVRNAKTTNDRGNGSHRTLLLDDLTTQELGALHEMVELVDRVQSGQILDANGKAVSFDELLKHMRDYLRRLTRQIFPATGNRQHWPTLYSLRHQVCADAKQSSTGSAESLRFVAALMGHKTDATATLHYGKRRGGSKGLRVRPSSENVATVEHRDPLSKFSPARDAPRRTKPSR
ncbi:site-specific integrase [Xanthomonas campestris pv. campestris]|nr:site-specific integrase [Xanthomonas campestris pv. campestris]MCD0270216.1 site-specific integrase [Xanthomonas campestris pv. campestris]